MLLEVLLLAPVALLLNRKSPALDPRLFDPNRCRIRCPRCQWQPRREDRWLCEPGCRHVWNTFETAGICPGCGKEWKDTACLLCGGWSPHADWYEVGA